VHDVITGIYFACVMIICSLSVVMAVLVLNVHNRSPDAHTMPAAVSCYHSSILYAYCLLV